LTAGLLTGLGSTIIRTTVGRTRPTATAPQGFYGLRYHSQWIMGQYDFASFPSGHTATWAGLAGAAWFYRRRWGVAFLAAGLAVAWSRMALGCHHFSDVTASVVWGLGVGSWVSHRLAPAINTLWARVGLPGD
jgi:membrane-associated phospholipid phosphatase